MRTRRMICLLTALFLFAVVGVGTAGAATLSATEGSAFATPASMAAHFTATFDAGSGTYSCPAPTGATTVDWGDGSAPEVATITSISTAATGSVCPGLVVPLQHVYRAPGTYQLRPANSSWTNDVVVADAPLTLESKLATVVLGTPVSGVIASFTSSWAAEPLSHFTAKVSWGDGSSIATGTLTANLGGRIDVTPAVHTFAAAGVYSVLTTIIQADAAPVSSASTVTVVDPLAGQSQQAVTPASANNAPAAQSAADTTAPKISKYAAVRQMFGIGRRSIEERVVVFNASDAGVAKLTFTKKVRGTFRVLGYARFSTVAGANTLRLSPKLRTKLNNAGVYRVTMTLTDGAGNTSSPRVAAFKVR